MLNILEVFHHRAYRNISGITEKGVADGTWEYPPVVAALEAAGLYTIQEYIRRRRVTIAAQVASLPIYELCIEADPSPGKIRIMRWWDQDVVQEYEE